MSTDLSQQELASIVVALRERVNELETRNAAPIVREFVLEPQEAERPKPEDSFGRRSLLRKVGLVAAGTAAATVASGALRPAAAGTGTGGTLQIGTLNAGNGSGTTPSTVLKVTNLAGADKAILGATDGPDPSFAGTAAIAGMSSTANVNVGIAGVSSYTDGIGVLGNGPTAGVFSSNTTHLKLTDAAGLNASLPTTAATLGRFSLGGEIVYDRSNNLWLGTGDGFTKLGGLNAAGAFHFVAPFRLYDSRSATKLAASTSRVHTATGGVVPAGATGVLCTLTLTQTEGVSGFLGLTSGTGASPTTSVVNWTTTNLDIAATVATQLSSAGQLKVWNNSTNATHYIVDIIGYYR